MSLLRKGAINPPRGRSPVVSYTSKPVKLYPVPGTAFPAKWCSSHATDWTFGSWVELVPPNTITSDFIIVGVIVIIDESKLSRAFTFEVGKGEAGSEEPIIPIHDYFEWYQTSDVGFTAYYFARTYVLPIPVKVGANTRIAIRAADDAGKATSYIARILYIKLPL